LWHKVRLECGGVKKRISLVLIDTERMIGMTLASTSVLKLAGPVIAVHEVVEILVEMVELHFK
jgi:hypothetical protein